MKNERKINIKTRGFYTNTKQRGTKEHWEGKECESKARSWEVEITKIA